MAQDNYIDTFDEDGNPVTFELIDIIEVDDIEYALLLPVDEESTEAEDDEVEVMRIKRTGDEIEFETIDDEEEFNRVAEYIQQIEDEMDD